jgi:division/cell wall cluster transcriptional repressor MraZ
LPDEELEKGFVLLKGEKECIYCYTHEHFRTIVDRVMGDEETRGDADFLRDFFEQVYAVDVDSQGRVVIASELRQEVGISGEAVVFIGHNDRIEIWDSDARKADRELAKADYQQKRSRLSRRIFGA